MNNQQPEGGIATPLPSHIPPSYPITMPQFVRQEQRYEWDCGLACVDMVLASCSLPLLSLQTRNSPTDVWSVDLTHLLSASLRADSSISPQPPPHNIILYSTAISTAVNPSYATLPYYSQSFPKQALRLPTAFAEAKSLGVTLIERRISLEDIQTVLKTGNSRIILLCDAALLTCTRASCIRALKKPRASSYSGHYVILHSLPLSFQPPSDSFALIIDPATGTCKGGCQISIASLESARSALGTDNDVIMVVSVE